MDCSRLRLISPGIESCLGLFGRCAILWDWLNRSTPTHIHTHPARARVLTHIFMPICNLRNGIDETCGWNYWKMKRKKNKKRNFAGSHQFIYKLFINLLSTNLLQCGFWITARVYVSIALIKRHHQQINWIVICLMNIFTAHFSEHLQLLTFASVSQPSQQAKQYRFSLSHCVDIVHCCRVHWVHYEHFARFVYASRWQLSTHPSDSKMTLQANDGYRTVHDSNSGRANETTIESTQNYQNKI